MGIAAAFLVALSIWAQGFRKRTRDLVGNRNIFFALSGAFLVVSIGAMVFKGFNLGMDFAGGTIVEVGFVANRDKITPEVVRGAIKTYSDEHHLEFQDAQVQVEERALRAGEDLYRRVIIRVGRTDKRSLTTDEIEGMAAHLDSNVGQLYRQAGKSLGLPASSPSPSGARASASGLPGSSPSPSGQRASASGLPSPKESVGASGSPAAGASPSPSQGGGTPRVDGARPAAGDMSSAILSRETIDPIIGSELWVNSLLALVVALVLQLLYITFRFGNQIRYGLAADIALVHDVVIMAGLYALTSRQVDSPFLAALLTVIGYSVMDSIVVFDRIRENVRQTHKGNYAEICNASVNQTMSRSVNTTLTVLLTLFALFFFGGDTLRNFAFALLVGITCGAYSSIFIATPLVVIIDNWVKRREEERVAERRRAREAAAVMDVASQPRAPGPARAGLGEPGPVMQRRSTDSTDMDFSPTSLEEDDERRPSGAAVRRRRTRRRR